MTQDVLNFDEGYHLGELAMTLLFAKYTKDEYLHFTRSGNHFIDLLPILIDFYPKEMIDPPLVVKTGYLDQECAPYCYDCIVAEKITDDTRLKNKAHNALIFLIEKKMKRKFNLLCNKEDPNKLILTIDECYIGYNILSPFQKELIYWFKCSHVDFVPHIELLRIEKIPDSWVKCPKCYFYHGNNHELCSRCYNVEILHKEEIRYLC